MKKDKLHISLMRRNLEICELSIFFWNYWRNCLLNQTWNSEIIKLHTGEHTKMVLKEHTKTFLRVLSFWRNIQKKIGFYLDFFGSLQNTQNLFSAIRTYKRFLYVLIFNSPCTSSSRSVNITNIAKNTRKPSKKKQNSRKFRFYKIVGQVVKAIKSLTGVPGVMSFLETKIRRCSLCVMFVYGPKFWYRNIYIFFIFDYRYKT